MAAGVIMRFDFDNQTYPFIYHEEFRNRKVNKELKKSIELDLPIDINSMHCGSLIQTSKLLPKETWTFLFRKMNFLKWKASKYSSTGHKTRARNLLNEALNIKKILVQCNTRIAVKNAVKQSHRVSISVEELISEAYFSLSKAVDLFDVYRGFCFSTYVTKAIFADFYRQIQYHLRNRPELTGNGELDLVDYRKPLVDDPEYLESKSYVQEILDILLPHEKDLIVRRFGLDENGIRTLDDLAKEKKITKEAIRQHQLKITEKIRKHIKANNLNARGLSLMSA